MVASMSLSPRICIYSKLTQKLSDIFLSLIIKNGTMTPGLVAHACNLSNQEAEAGGLQVQEQLGLHGETLSQKATNNNS
jgi:hypothetical protein